MNIVVVGGSGGIGQAFVDTLANRDGIRSIAATYSSTRPELTHAKVEWHQLDIRDEGAIQAWSDSLTEVDWLINAVGMLHRPDNGPEKSIRQFDPAFFIDNMMVNAMPSMLLAKHILNKFRHGRPSLFATISAKVGSIEDNRLGGWVSYRASKAALNMGLKTLAIECRRTLPNLAVAALHPGTTDTGLSRPFQGRVPEGKLFTPQQSVRYMLDVMGAITPDKTGKFWAYDGEVLPW